MITPPDYPVIGIRVIILSIIIGIVIIHSYVLMDLQVRGFCK
jgi:hypothetical protein